MLYNEVLARADKELIEAWISDYALDEVNCGGSRASLEYVLRYWNSEKMGLFKMFGENLIISKEVAIAKEIGDMEREIGDLLYYRGDEQSMRPFYNNMNRAVDMYWSDMGVNRWTIMDLFASYCLAKNVYEGDSFTVNVPNGGKPIQVQRGCKPVKILGKIAAAYKVEGFEEFRLCHSRVLNQKMLKGELCLSIHPMDYMTMSDNDYDWDSCMSWRNGGCYRRGTVEMMNSDCVVVAYLRGKEDMRFYDKYWNNKKWRQLFIVKPECVVGIKGYPYQHDGLATECVNWLCELAEKNNGWEYKKEVYTMSHESWFKVDGEDWKYVFYCDTMYNDFGNSCDHKIRVTANPAQVYEHKYEINYSGREVCMYCGEDGSRVDFDGEEPLTCNRCSDYVYCCCCEDRVNPDDAIEVDGSWYCRYCYDEHVVECPVSGREHHESNMVTLNLIPDDFPVEKMNDRSAPYSVTVSLDDICDRYTVSDELFSRYFIIDPKERKFERYGSFWRELFYVKLSDLTEEGRAMFDLCDESDMEWFLKHHQH